MSSGQAVEVKTGLPFSQKQVASRSQAVSCRGRRSCRPDKVRRGPRLGRMKTSGGTGRFPDLGSWREALSRGNAGCRE